MNSMKIALIGVPDEAAVALSSLAAALGVDHRDLKLFGVGRNPREVLSAVMELDVNQKPIPSSAEFVILDSLSPVEVTKYTNLKRAGIVVRGPFQVPPFSEGLDLQALATWGQTGVYTRVPEPIEEVDPFLALLDDDDSDDAPWSPLAVEPESAPIQVPIQAEPIVPAQGITMRTAPPMPGEVRAPEPPRPASPVSQVISPAFQDTPVHPTENPMSSPHHAVMDDDDIPPVPVPQPAIQPYQPPRPIDLPSEPRPQPYAPAAYEVPAAPYSPFDRVPEPSPIPAPVIQPLPKSPPTAPQPPVLEHLPKWMPVEQPSPQAQWSPSDVASLPPYVQQLSPDQRAAQKFSETVYSVQTPLVSNGRGKVYFCTGSHGGAGKTTVSWIAANALSLRLRALHDSRPVYLIEVDWNNPKLEQRLASSFVQGTTRNLGALADEVSGLVNRGLTQAQLAQAILERVEYHTIEMPDSGLRILVCPYAQTSTPDRIAYAIISAINVARSRDGFVFLDAGNSKPSSYDTLQARLAGPQSDKLLMVTDPTHESDLKRALHVIGQNSDPRFRKGPDQINVFLNRATPDQVVQLQGQIQTPVSGSFPFIKEISDQGNGWAGMASPSAVTAMVSRVGFFLREIGIQEMKGAFDTTEPVRTSFWKRMFGRLGAPPVTH